MDRILLFEPDSGGHRPLYIYSLVRYWIENCPPGKLFILVSQELLDESSNFLADFVNHEYPNIEFITMSAEEVFFIKSPRILMLRSIRQMQLLNKYAKVLKLTHCFAMFFDPLQFPLAVGLFRNLNCKLSGIFFHPSFHYGEFDYSDVKFKEKMARTRKKILLRLAMCHPKLYAIFSLDIYAIPYIQRLNSEIKVIFLPESLAPNLGNSESELWNRFHIDNDRKVFLVFGVIKRKKGIYELLDSAQYLPIEIAKKTCLLFVGKIDHTEKDDFLKFVGRARSISPIQILIHDEFIPEKEIQNIFRLSDIILAVYPSHIGSSGIVIQAAAAQKPLLASKHGLLGKIVRQNNFGLTIDAKKPQEIARGISEMYVNAEKYCDQEKMKEFIKNNNYSSFASTIFNNLITRDS